MYPQQSAALNLIVKDPQSVYNFSYHLTEGKVLKSEFIPKCPFLY
mgnify:CR=1